MKIKPPQALQTRYGDVMFRSRLEARWASCFDRMGIRWDYEPEGYKLANGECYLPDFWLPQLNCFAEVKPTQLTNDEFSKAFLLRQPCLLLDGQPELRFYFVVPNPTCLDPWGETDLQEQLEIYRKGDTFGRLHIPESIRRGRLWYVFGESIGDYLNDDFVAGISHARSMRFTRAA